MKRIFVVALFLCLWGPSLAVAQNSIGYGRDTLRGIKGFSVVVEDLSQDAKAGGLVKDQIQTDAEVELRKVGIRLLTSEEAGTEFLDLQVAVVKIPTLPLYTYGIQLRFFQNVYLARDPSKLTVSPTWGEAWVGYARNNHLEAGVRGKVKDFVNQFINDYLAVNPK